MKINFKKVFIAIIFISSSIVSFYCQKKFSLECIHMFFNVEALASGEQSGYICFDEGSLDCPNGIKVWLIIK